MALLQKTDLDDLDDCDDPEMKRKVIEREEEEE